MKNLLDKLILSYDVNEIHEVVENTSFEYFVDELKTFSREDKVTLINDLWNNEEV
jgi:hypothetical protein